MCLSGPEFKRCALDTLWYVTGKPGAYQLHHRKVDEVEDELCLDKINCHLPESATRLGSCKHCGAKKWNILGDQESGYVLSEDGGKVGAGFRDLSWQFHLANRTACAAAMHGHAR